MRYKKLNTRSDSRGANDKSWLETVSNARSRLGFFKALLNKVFIKTEEKRLGGAGRWRMKMKTKKKKKGKENEKEKKREKKRRTRRRRKRIRGRTVAIVLYDH